MRKYVTRNVRTPSVLIAYPGPLEGSNAQDVFLYLRPETNGLLVESLLFRVIKSDIFSKKCEVVYLANMPGDYIVKNRIIEQHYAVKIRFARLAKAAFTRAMQEKFERYFLASFAESKIIGAFQALRLLGLSNDDLFRLWVPPHHFAVINGQTIKRFNDYFIVNYDIPAILHKNNRMTDFAAMIFRSRLSRTEFHYMVQEMRNLLVAEQVIAADRPLSRTFHYSTGPFEQILDGIGYLYDADANHLPVEQISFCSFLMKNGIDKKTVIQAVRNPIMRFKTADGLVAEENLFQYTADDTYEEALSKFRRHW